MEEPTNRLSFDPERVSDYRLVADAGNPSTPDGLTRAVLLGEGELNVTIQGGGDEPRAAKEKPPSWSVKVGPATVLNLFTRAAQLRWGRPFPQRLGLPDETILTLSFVDARLGEVSLKMWLEDAERDEMLSSLLTTLRQVVEAATDGKAYL